jgi:hypothetical protein
MARSTSPFAQRHIARSRLCLALTAIGLAALPATTANAEAAATLDDGPGSQADRQGRSDARVVPARERRGSKHRRKRCRRGYRKVRRHGRIVCKRKHRHPSTPATPTTPAGSPASEADLQQQILDDTYELTTKFGEEAINGSHGSLPYWYHYEVNRGDCALLSADTGRCLISLWQWNYGTGYGYGGYDASIWRDYYIATRVGDRLYEPKIVQIDFLDPYAWVCSDTPRGGVPPCSS